MIVTRSITDLPDSTRTGVYALETDSRAATALTKTLYQNVLYMATGKDGRFISTSPIALAKGNSYQTCAYAPYQSVVNDPTAIAFTHGTDVLYAPSVPVTISGSTASATLTYAHMLSQIQFILIPGDGSPDLTGATLNVAGFYASCTLNMMNGTITPVTGSGATVTDINRSVCFVTDTRQMVLKMTVTTIGGRVYTGMISRVFLPSYSYTYTLMVNNTELEIFGQIVDWVPIKGGGISVE